RRRNRTQPPARPAEQDGLVPVRGLPRDHVAPANPCAAQTARQPGNARLEPDAVEADAGRVVDNEVAACTAGCTPHESVERGDVPRASRRQVVARSRVAVCRPERHAPTTEWAGGPLEMLDITATLPGQPILT